MTGNATTTANSPTAHYLVGIDLGTTHTVVAYADIRQGIANSQPQLFQIEQLVAPGEVAKKPLLPSFRYHPANGELAPQDLLLPWQNLPVAGEIGQAIIGEWARELGSKVDGRLVASAKSWLSHPQVDRSADILPWAAAEDVDKVSPVVASASYLNHVRQAWNHEHPDAPLEQQEVVVTVPASFDEVARSLTLEAAKMAGLGQILLLEEPQAVVYDWYAQNQDNAEQLLNKVRLLMVCDVGGGTTDLSLIKVAVDGQLSLTRVGVGDHLMLGGDNLDLALAHRAEQRIVGDGKRLNAASLSQLIQQTRNAKELLLAQQAPETAKVTVLGSGARLIGGAKSCDVSRNEVRELALEGFFPCLPFTDVPSKRRSAVVEFGLPYASDPAITKHLAEFLQRHANVCADALGQAVDAGPAIPDAVLFNGGVFNSETLGQRCLDALSGWSEQPVQQLHNQHPNLSVAYGAVAYGKARHGAQLKIGGGSARSYFLLIDGDKEQKQAVCLLPKGTNEDQEVRLGERKFALRLGQPVRFHLVSSTGDSHYDAGELVTINEDDYVFLPPLIAALDKDPKQPSQAEEVEVALVSNLTEVGTLQLDAVSSADDQQRWNVEFQIRKDLAKLRQQQGPAVEMPANFAQASDRVDAVYGEKRKDFDPKAVKKLRNELDKLLGKRDQWETPVLRELADQMIDAEKRRRRSDAHERVWFNILGYCLRPGFGYPLDDRRLQLVWPLLEQGMQFSKENHSWSEWWTFWRRLAGGLNQQQQQTLFDQVSKYLDPAALRSRKLQQELKNKSYEDMVRLAASLEHLPVSTKTQLCEWLLERLKKSSETQTSWWALGRIASRDPFHGSSHKIIPSDKVQTWLPQLLKADWKKNPSIAFATVMMARMTGDRSRDLDDNNRKKVIDKLKSSKSPAMWVDMVSEVKELTEAETKRVFGEALPSGLKLIE